MINIPSQPYYIFGLFWLAIIWQRLVGQASIAIMMIGGSWFYRAVINMYDDRGKLILYSSDDRGKFKFKNLFGNPFYLFPGFQAFSGIFKTTHTKSTWKKPAFGTGLIRGTQGNHIEKWVAKCHFLIVKSRLFAPPPSNYLGLEPILRHFGA